MTPEDFQREYLGTWTREETNQQCTQCENPHMEFKGMTNSGYPKYKCQECKCSTCLDPKKIALRNKIDARSN